MFFLFNYGTYYPGGGESDCHGIYATLDEAKEAARGLSCSDFCYICTASVEDGFEIVWDADDKED
jgi:hypothetical protein